MGLFKSNDTTLSSILEKINIGKIQLPDFQRGWVWDDNRIKALISSIAKTYPVGAVMFLDYGSENIRFKYRPFTGLNMSAKPNLLVLDGQQRLTSAYCAMYSRNVVETQDDKKNPLKRFYYFDIKKALEVDEIEEAILSIPEDKKIKKNFGKDIELDISNIDLEFKEFMFPLNIVFDVANSSKWRNEFFNYHKFESKAVQIYTKFENQIISKIQTYSLPVITLEESIPKEAVCQVFENVNTGGVSLTVFELVTATFAADDFELRPDWEKRYEKMKQKSAITPSSTNDSILSTVSSTDFLTAITLLIRYHKNLMGGLAVSCKRKDILNIELEDYKLYADILTDGFIKASNFLKEQRIFLKRDLPYSTQLIPLSVIFAVLGNKITDNSKISKISRWYWSGVLGERYGAANETRYVKDLTEIIPWLNGTSNIEPETVSGSFFQPTRLLSLRSRNSAAYKGIMALILKNGAKDFITGANMDITNFVDEYTDIHHIFPQVFCMKNNLPYEMWNSIINKTPIFGATNRSIGGNAPSKYLQSVMNTNKVKQSDLETYLNSHCININHLTSDDFNNFIKNRADRLLELIERAMGKRITDRQPLYDKL